jgi:hypothetical protein
MTSLHILPADDPSSVESFLRARKSQLRQGHYEVHGTWAAAERRSAEDDADRIMDLLRRMPVEEYIPAADAGPAELEAAQYRWLHRHGLERGRVDAALAAKREQLGRRVHPLTRPSVTAGGGQTGVSVTSRSRPSPAVAPRRERTWGEAQVARFGVVYPRSTGSPRSGRPDRPVRPDQGRREPRTPRLTGSTTPPANRRGPGGRAMRRTVRG